MVTKQYFLTLPHSASVLPNKYKRSQRWLPLCSNLCISRITVICESLQKVWKAQLETSLQTKNGIFYSSHWNLSIKSYFLPSTFSLKLLRLKLLSFRSKPNRFITLFSRVIFRKILNT